MSKIQDTSGQDRVIQRRRSKGVTFAILTGVAAVVTAGVLLAPRLSKWTQASQSFEKSRLRFAVVERGSLVQDISVEGRIVASSYPTIYAPAQGTVTLEVKAGDPVIRGQILASVDSPELRNSLLQESSQLAALQADLDGQRITMRTSERQNRQQVDLNKLRMEAAERELKRNQTLFKEGLISQMDLDTSRDALAVARLEHGHSLDNAELEKENMAQSLRNREKQVERQQLVVDEAQRRVGELQLKSPVDGVIGSLSIDPKDTVARNQELLTVIDLSAFEISIDIPEVYADEIQRGVRAEITYEGRQWPGEVLSVSPEVNNSLVQGRVAFTGDLPRGLKQNQRVSTRIILGEKNDVLTVRRGPALDSGGGRKIYVVRDGVAVLDQISLGARSISKVEILSGLQEGDEIVISDTTRFNGAERVLLR